MSNQYPLNPMDNQQIVEQISQIRSIEASSRLTSTLEGVLLGQNLATASSLLGQTITGMTDDGQQESGWVERVSLVDGAAKLHVGDQVVSLKNVAGIVPYYGA